MSFLRQLPLVSQRLVSASTRMSAQPGSVIASRAFLRTLRTSSFIRQESAVTPAADTGSAVGQAAPVTVAQPQNQLNTIKYSRAMFQMVNENKYSQVIDIYNELIRVGLKPDITVFNYIVTAHLKLQNVNEAFSYLREMKSLGFQPPQRFLPIFWKVFMHTSDHERALSVLDLMIEVDMVPDAPKLSEAINILSQSRDPDALNKMLRYLNSARQFGIVLVKDAHEAIMLRCVREGNINLAFTIMQKYDREGRSFYLSNPILEKLLQFASQYDHMEAAGYILSKLRNNDVALEESTLNLVLYTSARLADPNLAEEAWKVFEHQKIVPSNSAHHSMLHALFAAQKIQDGFRFMIDAKLNSVSIPNTIQRFIGSQLAFNVVTLDNSFYALEEIASQGAEIPIEAINAIIYGCSQVGELDRAFATFSEIPKFNLKPSIDTYNALLYGCVTRNRYVTALRVLDDMKSAGVEPDAESYNAVVSISITHNQMARVDSLMQLMKNKGFRVSSQVYRKLARKYSRLGDIQAGLNTLDEMRKADYFVSNSLTEYVRAGGFRDLLSEKVTEAKKSISESIASESADPKVVDAGDDTAIEEEDNDTATVEQKTF